MRRFLAPILIILAAAAVAAIVLTWGESAEDTAQPSPHAIDQGD